LNFNTIQESVASVITSENKETLPIDFIDYVVKCLLYVESGEPDLERLTGKESNSKKLKKQCSFKKKNYLCDIIQVGYGFHKRHYNINETMVVGHFRWQSFGYQLTRIKLIWINEYSRRYDQ